MAGATLSGAFWYFGETKAQMLARPMTASRTPMSDADITEALACSFAGRDAPLGGKEPDAVGEVPADGDHGNHVDGEHPWVGEFVLDFGKGHAGIVGQIGAGETLADDVLNDVEERDEAGVALGEVHPVASPGVVNDIGFAAQPDVDAIDAVIEDGQEDKDPLEHANQGKAVEELDLCRVGCWAL